MSTLKTALVTAVVCLSAVSPAQAAKQVALGCEPSNPSSQNWVPKAIIVQIDPDTGRAAVLDDYTLQVFKNGVNADLNRPTPTRIKLDWKLIGVRNKQDRKQNVAFKMSINMTRMTFNYSSVADSSYVATGGVRGKCVLLTK